MQQELNVNKDLVSDYFNQIQYEIDEYYDIIYRGLKKDLAQFQEQNERID